MIPRFPTNNTTDIAWSNSEFIRKTPACIFPIFINISNTDNVFFSKFCVICSFSFCLSIFRNSVSYIVSASSKKKVVRINARRVVTFMTDAHPFWYRSLVNFKRVAMSIFVGCKRPIAIPNLFCIYPASRGFFCISPKSRCRAFIDIIASFTSNDPFCRKVNSAISAFLTWIKLCFHIVDYGMFRRVYGII